MGGGQHPAPTRAGEPRKAFHYHDKGIMAMIGRGAAIAEVGAHRHELHGVIAFSAWLGVHAMLMTGVRNRIDAFVAWGWDYFSQSRGPAGARPRRRRRIDWDEDAAPAPSATVTTFAVTTVDLAGRSSRRPRIYHFLFVPLTLGLAPLVAIMQTTWYRTGVDAWLRLTRFFGTLLLINFAIGVATGLVQEFQFGMNWSVYSTLRRRRLRRRRWRSRASPRSSWRRRSSGLWIFGWDRLSPRVHLATIWLVALGHVAVGVLHPRRELVDAAPGRLRGASTARRSSRTSGRLLDEPRSPCARSRTRCSRRRCTTGALVVLGVSLLAPRARAQRRRVPPRRRARAHRRRARDAREHDRRQPASATTSTDYQPMKIAAAEALWNTEQPASFSLFQIGGFSVDDQKPSFDIEVPHLLSILATRLLERQGRRGSTSSRQQEQGQFGPGNYMPPRRAGVLVACA